MISRRALALGLAALSIAAAGAPFRLDGSQLEVLRFLAEPD